MDGRYNLHELKRTHNDSGVEINMNKKITQATIQLFETCAVFAKVQLEVYLASVVSTAYGAKPACTRSAIMS